MLEEVEHAICELDGDSTVGPRGYTLQLFCVLMMTNQIGAIWY